MRLEVTELVELQDLLNVIGFPFLVEEGFGRSLKAQKCEPASARIVAISLCHDRGVASLQNTLLGPVEMDIKDDVLPGSNTNNGIRGPFSLGCQLFDEGRAFTGLAAEYPKGLHQTRASSCLSLRRDFRRRLDQTNTLLRVGRYAGDGLLWRTLAGTAICSAETLSKGIH